MFPEYMWDLTPAWLLLCGSGGGNVWVNGVKVKENFLSPDAVMALKVSGDIQCGLLHVYIYKGYRGIQGASVGLDE